MKYAIIAAGEGSRLVEEGIKLPKPLVKLNGVSLIDRLIEIFIKNDAESISIIVNNEMKEVQSHIISLQSKISVPLNVVVKSTPSSMHSFFELSQFLQSGKFCLTTVDTIFKEDEFSKFIQAFVADAESDGIMAVTDYIDDEKPLYVEVDNKMKITGFHDQSDRPEYISGGIYCLSSKAITTLNHCMENGFSRMRNYQRQLIADGLNLKAFLFNKIIDVDHAEDIPKAEAFLFNIENRPHSDHALAVGDNPRAMIKIAGIKRENQYSPNHIDNDTAIFNLVVEHLKKSGYEVSEYSENDFLESSSINAEIIFNMARDKKSIRKLQQLEDEGKLVVNSGYGIENCMREKMTRLLISNQIPHPHSIIVSTNKPLPVETGQMLSNCWIKRGDFHAVLRTDVCYTKNREEAENTLNEYALRGIDTAVINEHLTGDLIKFYGVADTGFFHWFYPDVQKHSKFGLEVVNGKALGISFDISALKNICNQAAKVLNIYIYGGDGVVDAAGNIRIIDFNDWPSFAPCRTEAAPYIAQCIEKRIREKVELIKLNNIE